MKSPDIRKKRLSRKLLAVTAFLLTTSPITAFANPLGEKDWQQHMPSNRPNAPFELLNYRTPQSQTFVNPNGTFTTKLYQSPVFFKNSNGHWQNVDNSLASDGNGGFQNKQGPYTVDFPSSLANAGAISVSMDPKDILSMSLEGATETQTATTNGSGIDYPSVEPGVDLNYSAESNQLKEAIVLNNASATNTFSFILHAPGVTFTKQSDGSITGQRGNKTIFVIPAPFMTDQNGVQSNAVTTSLSSAKGGDTVLTLTADQSWLDDSSRAWPVTIDPTVQPVSVAPTSQWGLDTGVFAHPLEKVHFRITHSESPLIEPVLG